MSVDIFLRGDRRSLIPFYSRTYTFNDRRYGYYQPNGYGRQYPGQNTADQYPAGSPLGEDRFKYDPVSESVIEENKGNNLARQSNGVQQAR